MNYTKVIVKTVNRESSVEFAETLEQAQEIVNKYLEECYKELNTSEEELLEFDEMDRYETGAWITFDDYDIDVDIFEIK